MRPETNLEKGVTEQSEVQLIEPEDLAAELGDERLLLVQVTSAQVYEQARIPGAVLVLPAELVCGVKPATGRLPEIDQLHALFSRIGYRPEQNIVVYDDEGGGWAGRFGWTLDVIGHRHWRYLNGGLHAWANAGLALQSGPASAPESCDVSLSISQQPIAEIPDVLATIDNPDQAVWDVRSTEEFVGQRQVSARVGHVPGAINLDWELLKDPVRHTRLRSDLEAVLADLGLADKELIITHCQTHHRSGLSYLVGRLLGWNIKAYHGSWSEWGNRDDTPVDVGPA